MWQEVKETKIYMAYNDDGLLDIVIGLGILITLVSLWASLIWLVGALAFIFFLVWRAAKQAVTAPRIQGMHLSAQRVRKLRRRWSNLSLVFVISVLMGLVVLGLTSVSVLGLSGSAGPQAQSMAWFYGNFPLVLALVAALLMAVTAFLVGIWRFYAYALLTLLLVTVGHLLHVSGFLYGSLLGAIFLLSGTAHLFYFVHQYPEKAA